LQVRGNYIRCILWYIVCCCFPHHHDGWRSRKQHLLSTLSHVSRWEGNIAQAQQILSHSLHPRALTFLTYACFPSFSTKQKTTLSSSRFQLKHHNPLLPLDSLNRFTSSQSLHYHFHLEHAQNHHNRFILSSFTLHSFQHHLHYHPSLLTVATITRVQHKTVK